YLEIDGRRLGPFYTFRELSLKNRASWIRYEMDRLHDRVMKVKTIVPPEPPRPRPWWKFWGSGNRLAGHEDTLGQPKISDPSLYQGAAASLPRFYVSRVCRDRGLVPRKGFSKKGRAPSPDVQLTWERALSKPGSSTYGERTTAHGTPAPPPAGGGAGQR